MGPFVMLALSFLSIEASASTACNPPSLCQAFWTGAEYSETNGVGFCVAMSTSGCSNPFSYPSMEDCMRVHGMQGGGPSCKAFWAGWEFNSFEGRCQRVTASGCRNPFRFHSEEQCAKFHPEVWCLGGK